MRFNGSYAALGLAVVVVASCAQIVGAHFDVVGETGGNNSTASGSSGMGGGAGAPVVLANDVYPFDIAVDDTYVYWTARGADMTNGSIRRIHKDGSGAVQTLLSSLGGVNRLLLSNGYVYFSVSDLHGMVGRVSTQEPFSEDVIAMDIPAPLGLAMSDDGNTLYYSSQFAASPSTSVIYAVGVTPQIGSTIPFAEVPNLPAFLAVKDGFLWGDSPSTGHLWNLALQGSPPIQSMPVVDISFVNAVTAAPHGVIVGQFADDASVNYYPLGGSVVVAQHQNRVAEIAGDLNYIYWAAYGSGKIYRGTYDGGTPSLVQDNEPDVNGLTIDDSFIYFTRYDPEGAVLKMPKPP